MGYFSVLLLGMFFFFHGSAMAQERGNCLRFGSIGAKVHQQISVKVASYLTKNGLCVEILYAPHYPTLRAIEVRDLSAHIWLRHDYADLGQRLSNILKNLDLKTLSP